MKCDRTVHGRHCGIWAIVESTFVFLLQTVLSLVKVAYYQFAPEYLNVESNLEAVENGLSSADADLVVLPELFTSGYFFKSKEDLAKVAENIPGGRSSEALQAWAASLNAVLVAGLPEQEGGAFYNSAVVVQPTGEVATYRKVHLYYEEKTLFEPGNLGFRVVDVAARDGTTYRLGVMVCFDWYFPEAARTLALKGADVIAHPSNLVLPYCPDSMPVRARENHVFTITANRYGTEKKRDHSLTFTGLSEVCDPGGTILRRAGKDSTELGMVEIDPLASRDRKINQYNDVLGDRRPESYLTERQKESSRQALP